MSQLEERLTIPADPLLTGLYTDGFFETDQPFVAAESYISSTPTDSGFALSAFEGLNTEDAGLPGTPDQKGFIERYKTKAILASAVGSAAVMAATDSMGQIMHGLDNAESWIAPAWSAGIAGHVGGLAMMLAAGGKSVNWSNFKNFKELFTNFSEDIRESKLMKAGFAVNTTGAVGAAGVVSYGIVDTLPPSSWGLLAYPALDLYSTGVLRTWIWGKIKSDPAVK